MSVEFDSGFDANAKENQREHNVIPKGEYLAIMTKSEKVETKNKDGYLLNTQWQIVNGEFQNRTLFHKFNLWLEVNTDKRKTAVKIARGQLSDLCKAVGIQTLKSTGELHNKPVIVRVRVTDNGDGYGPQNDIAGFKATGKIASVAATAGAGRTAIPVGSSSSNSEKVRWET